MIRGEHRLSSGRTLAFAVGVAGGCLALGDDVLRFLPPPGGVGGASLVVSPDERHAALWVYTGQAEQEHRLFALMPFALVRAVAQYRGMSDAPVFSPDGRWLVTFVATEPRVRATGDHYEDAFAEDATDEVVVDFATLLVQAVPGGEVRERAVGVTVLRSCDPDIVTGWHTHGGLAMLDTSTALLRLPSGEQLAVDLGAEGPVAGTRSFPDAAGTA